MNRPEHPRLLAPGWWWACDEPERPADGNVSWHIGCDACLVHVVAVLHTVGDQSVTGRDDRLRPLRFVSLAEVLRIVMVHREAEGLPTWPIPAGAS